MKKDLNQSNVETERWNRMDHMLRLISWSQIQITIGDDRNDLHTMYQGCQSLLDTITPDFSEKPKEEDKDKYPKGTILRGPLTYKFRTYRTLLDQAQMLNNRSGDPSLDSETRTRLKNSSYKKLQTLKYLLLQECEKLGYNAKKTDRTDVYREGNN